MEEKLQEILNAALKNGKIIDTVCTLAVATTSISSVNCIGIMIIITIIIIMFYRILIMDNILKRVSARMIYDSRFPSTYTSLLDTSEYESTAKTDKIEFEVKALKDELHSVREDILHTIRAMPPVMGEGFASAASRFEFSQEQEEELRIRKKDKDK